MVSDMAEDPRSGSGEQKMAGRRAIGPLIRIAALTVCVTSAWACHETMSTGPHPDPRPTFTLSGSVIDIATRRPIAGATVVTTSGSTPTDQSGNYSIRLLQGTYIINVVATGYVVEMVTIDLRGDTTHQSALAIRTPDSPTTSDLSGTWSGSGTYPNSPFTLFLEQSGGSLVGYYKDQHDAGSVSRFTATTFVLRVDFGDAGLFLECEIDDARRIHGVMRTSALGNVPYPFAMTR